MLGGLLQDIGSLPLLSELEHWPDVPRDGDTLHELCERLSGDLGALILTRWQLPSAVIESTRLYGQWQRQHDGVADLADLVLLASALQANRSQDEPLPAQTKLGLEQPLAELKQELAGELQLWKRLLA
jgi:HD-like signal output (HDOD) protein